jgi:hypothetical protein
MDVLNAAASESMASVTIMSQVRAGGRYGPLQPSPAITAMVTTEIRANGHVIIVTESVLRERLSTSRAQISASLAARLGRNPFLCGLARKSHPVDKRFL